MVFWKSFELFLLSRSPILFKCSFYSYLLMSDIFLQEDLYVVGLFIIFVDEKNVTYLCEYIVLK